MSVAVILSLCSIPESEMISDWELYSVHQDVDPEVVRRKTTEAENMVNRMSKLNLSPKQPIATEELANAHEGEFRIFRSSEQCVCV